jgi:hypothetical protein
MDSATLLIKEGGGYRPISQTSPSPAKRGAHMTKKEEETIEQLADEAEVITVTDYEKKDLKEKRGVIKQTLFDGSKKLKHSVPKGKRV